LSNFRICLRIILILILIPLTLVPNNNKVLAQSLSNYTDPNGNYVLQYPSDWHANGPKNLGNHMPLILTIGPKYTGPNLIQMIISVVASEKNQNVSLESLKNLSMIINSQDLPTFHIIEDATYNKYKIDKYPAVSYTFGYDDSTKMKELYVGSKINNTVFHIGYAAPENEYDQFLPSVEKILSTMRTLRAN
jgi:hypothetical protein